MKIDAYSTEDISIDLITRNIILLSAMKGLVDDCVDGARAMRPHGDYRGLSVDVEMARSSFVVADSSGGFYFLRRALSQRSIVGQRSFRVAAQAFKTLSTSGRSSRCPDSRTRAAARPPWKLGNPNMLTRLVRGAEAGTVVRN